MYVCTACNGAWTVRLAACPGRGCGGTLRPAGPADADHAVLRRFPMAHIRGSTTTVTPAATAAVAVPDLEPPATPAPPVAGQAKARARKTSTRAGG